jgi:hypothetical protein
MSEYTKRVIMTAPVDMADLCAAIGRGVDEDLGGSASFRFIHASYDAEGLPVGEPSYLESAFYATPDFAAGVFYLWTMPIQLHQTIARDYSLRWPDLHPPTLQEIQAWCAATTFEAF